MYVLQHALGREEVGGCSMVRSLCNTRLRRPDSATFSHWTQESHRTRLHQSPQVRRRHRNDNDDISRQKVPLITVRIAMSCPVDI